MTVSAVSSLSRSVLRYSMFFIIYSVCRSAALPAVWTCPCSILTGAVHVEHISHRKELTLLPVFKKICIKHTHSNGSSSDMLWSWQPKGLTLSLQRAVDLRDDVVGMEVLARLWQECINALVPLEQKPLIYVYAMQGRCIGTLFLVPAGGFVWQIWFCFHRERNAVSSKSHLGSISKGENLIPRQSSAAEWRLGRRQEEV